MLPSMGGGAVGGGAGAGPGVPVVECRTLFIRNLPFEYRSSDLREMMKKAGRVADLRLPKGDDGRGRGIAFVEFDTTSDAEQALRLFSNVMVDGRTIGCSLNPTNSTPSGGTGDRDRETRPRRKTRMCQHFIKGSCHKGEHCSFAHHPREIEGGGAPPPSAGRPPPGSAPRPLDWLCPHCNNNNFASRTACNRCGAPKGGAPGPGGGGMHPGGGPMGGPMGGGQVGYGGGRGQQQHGGQFGGPGRGGGGGGRGMGPPGPGRPGDWNCPQCSNVNFASRHQCNRCGAAKPYVAPRGMKSGGIDGGVSWK